MAKAAAARQFGDEYQQLVFWKYALRMLSGNYEIDNISSMIREMISVCHNNIELLNPDIGGNYIKQIFILTHNAYFHREITYNQVDFYDSVSFFMIRKSENQSSITLCVDRAEELSKEDKNVNPVQNAYMALWAEYKEL